MQAPEKRIKQLIDDSIQVLSALFVATWHPKPRPRKALAKALNDGEQLLSVASELVSWAYHTISLQYRASKIWGDLFHDIDLVEQLITHDPISLSDLERLLEEHLGCLYGAERHQRPDLLESLEDWQAATLTPNLDSAWLTISTHPSYQGWTSDPLSWQLEFPSTCLVLAASYINQCIYRTTKANDLLVIRAHAAKLFSKINNEVMFEIFAIEEQKIKEALVSRSTAANDAQYSRMRQWANLWCPRIHHQVQGGAKIIEAIHRMESDLIKSAKELGLKIDSINVHDVARRWYTRWRKAKNLPIQKSGPAFSK